MLHDTILSDYNASDKVFAQIPIKHDIYIVNNIKKRNNLKQQLASNHITKLRHNCNCLENFLFLKSLETIDPTIFVHIMGEGSKLFKKYLNYNYSTKQFELKKFRQSKSATNCTQQKSTNIGSDDNLEKNSKSTKRKQSKKKIKPIFYLFTN